jgi:hypothetical protein
MLFASSLMYKEWVTYFKYLYFADRILTLCS